MCLLAAAVLPAAAEPVAAAGALSYEAIATSPHVHCAFYRSYDIDPQTGGRLLVEGLSSSLAHYQRRRNGGVRAIDTRRAGAAEARLVRGRYLHYIVRSAGMYEVTTVYACIGRDAQSGVCTHYGAVNARHFDHRVLRDPDRVYEELQAAAEPGFCDHSFIHLQSASRGPVLP